MDKDTTPTPVVPPGAKYRGAVVEDLQLPPAFCLPQDAQLSRALEAAYEREFDQLPVLNDRRKPIGYLDVRSIRKKFESGQAGVDDEIALHINHFPLASQSHPYTVIHPLTPLEELESFFSTKGTDFALVTDMERKWVLAVATKGMRRLDARGE
ncbi:hypothetical protein BD324DRAFT_131734 [Kockovaella imperatae]|uniref:CBS domain-containing protein n=1 Tax=Kockovaella imperatae TaxID=4999 RepID=A0A1Y1UB53_9TREE|nr:hypothetical protein BD324DRAFT_131734 [Kockovaella imperatae]ORX34747.1 hypothetical protein BD324DRAFT_131734 [Kockovaella imperatae]